MIRDLTSGKPLKVIVGFALPMLLSMVFQQLYNIVDSVIAGRYVGVSALAAVGASFPITSLFIAIASGASIGCSVIVSQLFGAKDFAKMKSAISTSILSLLGLSVVLLVGGLIFCSPLMHLINTPKNIFEDSALYLRVYILGMIFLFVYNAATAIFNALGDSRTPLIFLIFSSLLNVVLDLVFVRVFKMGVGGVAWATFIAQGISSILAISYLFVRLKKIPATAKFRYFDGDLLKNISRVAIPSILQQSFISVGQFFVQGLINEFGETTVAGYSAAFKINTFAIVSITTISNALSSFVAQNIGAKKFERIKEGYKGALLMAEGFCLTVVAIILVFGKNILGLFVNPDAAMRDEVIQIGMQFLYIAVPFYAVVTAKIATDGVLKGSGSMKAFMISTFSDL
ncbi:MAG: MATE family efflux transporter, partial [Oscillospiraceae bacterium]